MFRLKILWYRLFKRSIMDQCLESAFEDLQLLIKEVFINVSKMPGQLSFDEFVYLFGNYDWKDIIDAFEELDNNEFLYSKSVFKIINEILILNVIPTLGSKWSNSYLKFSLGLTKVG